MKNNLAFGAKGGAIAFLLKIFNTVFGFLNQVILARILGAGGVGEVILAITIVRISIQVAKFGMEEAMMKFVPLYVDHKDESRLKGSISFAIKFCLLFSGLFMLIILALSKFISLNIFHSEGLLKLLPIIVISIPAWGIRDVISGILRGYKDTLRALIPETLISPFSRIAIFLILILKGGSPLYAIIAFVAGEVLAAAVSIKFLLNRVRGLKHIKGECDRKKVLDVAYTIIFTSMSALIYTQADIWILGIFRSTEIVGIYGIASKLVFLIYFPMLAFTAIIPPLVSSIYASGDLRELRKIVTESTRWILSMAMPIILILFFEGRYILEYVFGPEFTAGYPVVLILIFGQLIKAGSGLVGILLQMTGQHKFYMKINIFWGIINIILNIILVPRYGMIGAAVSTAFCLSMLDIICIFISYKRLSVLTLAKGLHFDIAFLTVVGVTYWLLAYNNYYVGHHFLVVAAIIFYLGKSIRNHDIPWRLLIAKHK